MPLKDTLFTRAGKRQPIEKTRRYEVYRTICEYADKHGGNSPTERRLAILLRKRMRYSTVRGHIERLIEDGLIKKVDGEIVITGSEWRKPKGKKKGKA